MQQKLPVAQSSSTTIQGTQPRQHVGWRWRQTMPLYIMLLPALIGLAVFTYFPMYGLVIAFQNYNPLIGFTRSPFVGLANFQRMFSQPNTWPIIRNTLTIAVGKIALTLGASLVFALLLNEVRLLWFKRFVQTLSYLLHFLSWVLFGGILLNILSLDGVVNRALGALGLPALFFLGDPTLFPLTMIGTEVWKEFGFGAILFIAALTNIDPTFYEAAAVDGATRWQRTWHITIPGIAPMIVLLGALSMGSVLNAGFEQILVLYNPIVYQTGDIIDTYVYRTGLIGLQFSLAAAAGLLKAVVGSLLVALSYWLADRYANYRIF